MSAACWPRSRRRERLGPALEADAEPEAQADPSDAGRATVDRDRDARDGRVGLRGHDPRVGQGRRRRVAEDETIVEISTDKVDAEVPAPASGTLTEILAEAGDTVTVGQVIARMTAGRSRGRRRRRRQARPPRPAPPATPRRSSAGRPQGHARRRPRRRRPWRRPHARSRAPAPHGRIGKADVLALPRTNGASAAPAAAPHRPASRRSQGRERDARALHGRVAAIPTATSFRTITVTTLDGAASSSRRPASKVSFTHLIAYAIARAATEQMPVWPTTSPRSTASRT